LYKIVNLRRLADRLSSLFDSEIEIPRIKHGKKQTLALRHEINELANLCDFCCENFVAVGASCFDKLKPV
jgi:hypothetical protein